MSSGDGYAIVTLVGAPWSDRDHAGLTETLGCTDCRVDYYRSTAGETPLPVESETVCVPLEVGGSIETSEGTTAVPRWGVARVPAGTAASLVGEASTPWVTVSATVTDPGGSDDDSSVPVTDSDEYTTDSNEHATDSDEHATDSDEHATDSAVPSTDSTETAADSAVTVVDPATVAFAPPATSDVPIARLTATLGCAGMKVNVRRLAPGQIVPYHVEGSQEELFVPLDGPGTVRIDDEIHHVPAGGVARVAPPVPRSVTNESAESRRWFMVGAPPTGGPDEWDPGAEILE